MFRGVTPLPRGSVLSEGSAGPQRQGLAPHSTGLTTKQGPMGGGVWDPQKTWARPTGAPWAVGRGTGNGEDPAEPLRGFTLGQSEG